MPPAAIQDVTKLTFAMSIMWMYFFFSQYLVIWYGNVPIETRFFLRRFLDDHRGGYLAWVIFIVGWLIPFAYLLKRLTGRPPTRHKVLQRRSSSWAGSPSSSSGSCSSSRPSPGTTRSRSA